MPTHLRDYIVTNGNVSNDEFVNFVLFTYCDPLAFHTAIKDGWIHAMNDEFHSIEKNDTWKLTSLPACKNSIGVK